MWAVVALIDLNAPLAGTEQDSRRARAVRFDPGTHSGRQEATVQILANDWERRSMELRGIIGLVGLLLAALVIQGYGWR
jgi:hypothetical protein